jgi:prefoldin subunit 5
MKATTPKPTLNLSLKTMLSRNATAITDAQNSYDESVLNVSNGMSGITASQLPTLNAQPENWDEIVTAQTNAKTDALSWTNQVYAQLQNTPESVQNYNDTISALFTDALSQATMLIGDPTSATAKSLLNADLKNIKSTLSLVNIFVQGTLNSITRFGVTTLPDAVAQLNTQVNDAYEDVQIDQEAIDNLKQEIADLKAEIADLAADIGLIAAAVTAEVVVGIALIELGPGEWILLGATVAGAATVIALDSIKIEADQNKIKVLNAQLKSVEQDAAALQLMGDSYTALSASTTALNADVGNISSAWQTVEDDMTAAINDISEANEVYAGCSLLYINVQGNPAQLTISMTSDQVSAALAAYPTVDFVTYINNYPSPAAA